MSSTAHATIETQPRIDEAEIDRLDLWFRAANYLAVGQIYLLDNPLLERPLVAEDVKPRLLGHWGTTPGLNLLYAHLNRLIRSRDVNAIFLAGPGHGGPAAVANAWLEHTYSEVYPAIGYHRQGIQALFRQFSFPGGIPSHVAPETPGSIHEGGELGYVLSHAYGAAMDNPDLVVAAVIGDGEFETGPLAASWHANKFVDPVHDGAVLPILHLNGYKIANPAIPARIPRPSWRVCCAAMATRCSPSRVTILATYTDSWPPRWTPPTTASAPSRSRPGRRRWRAGPSSGVPGR